jgi:hypothetical protein
MSLLAAIVLPHHSQAAASWSAPKICEAAAFSYLFLDAMPVYLGDSGGQHQLQAADGQIYACEIEQGIALLSWNSESEGAVTSRRIIVHSRDQILFVRTDVLDRSFTLHGNHIFVND